MNAFLKRETHLEKRNGTSLVIRGAIVVDLSLQLRLNVIRSCESGELLEQVSRSKQKIHGLTDQAIGVLRSLRHFAQSPKNARVALEARQDLAEVPFDRLQHGEPAVDGRIDASPASGDSTRISTFIYESIYLKINLS